MSKKNKFNARAFLVNNVGVDPLNDESDILQDLISDLRIKETVEGLELIREYFSQRKDKEIYDKFTNVLEMCDEILSALDK